MSDPDADIHRWREYLRARGVFGEEDLQELESHLRDEIEDLVGTGLDRSEAFLIGIRRIGGSHDLAREFAKTEKENIWRQLVVEDPDREGRRASRREITLVVGLAFAGGAIARIPGFFGLRLFGGATDPLYLRFLAFAVVLPIAAWLATQRSRPFRKMWPFLAVMAAALTAALIYPSEGLEHTTMLFALHLPVLAWILLGILYVRDITEEGGMDYIRFTGETFVYTVLIWLGIGVFLAVKAVVFEAIAIDTGVVDRRDLLPVLLFAAPVIASWLAEKKRGSIENIAPLLAKIFLPLFLLLLVVFLGFAASSGRRFMGNRDTLIGIDFILLVIVAVVMYNLSSRPINDRPRPTDIIAALLVLAALAVDVLALRAVAHRLAEYGVSPNKLAALVMNILVAGNLVGLALLYGFFLTTKRFFRYIIRFQWAYFAVYALWSGVVVFLFPPIFHWA